MSFEVKQNAVKDLADVLKKYYPEIKDIEVRKYTKDGVHSAEFVVLTWSNGGYSTANNNCNSLSATIRNVARMIDGGVYENIHWYTEMMEEKEWTRIM